MDSDSHLLPPTRLRGRAGVRTIATPPLVCQRDDSYSSRGRGDGGVSVHCHALRAVERRTERRQRHADYFRK